MRWRDVSFFTALARSQKYQHFDLQPHAKKDSQTAKAAGNFGEWSVS
jgi:hypothetical protein